MGIHTVAVFIWLSAVLAAGDYISVQGHVYFQQSEVFRPTSSIELWSEFDVDMDTLCGGKELIYKACRKVEKTNTARHRLIEEIW